MVLSYKVVLCPGNEHSLERNWCKKFHAMPVFPFTFNAKCARFRSELREPFYDQGQSLQTPLGELW